MSSFIPLVGGTIVALSQIRDSIDFWLLCFLGITVTITWGFIIVSVIYEMRRKNHSWNTVKRK